MKMGVLSNLEPKKVFYYFEEITKIPHGSGNVEQISDFLVDFAKAHKLFYIQDAMKNVIMVKEATPGYEKEPVVILQGHMDMVAVQTPDCTMDMKTASMRRIPASAAMMVSLWLMHWHYWIPRTSGIPVWKSSLRWMRKSVWTEPERLTCLCYRVIA
mgnify:CR=1 FL=1